jgi:thiol-disulfide isomerase/thioredoxin
MKRNPILLAAVILTIATQLHAQQIPSPVRVMQKVADKLASVKHLGYKYRFEYSVPSQDRTRVAQGVAFLDLKPEDGTSQFRFQFDFEDLMNTYNGTEQFYLEKKGKKLHVESKPMFKSQGNISLQNSPLSLKYALPKIIADKSIPKKVSLTRTGNRDHYVIEFSLYKGALNSAGEIIETGPEMTSKYQLKVDKSTFLPVEVIETNDKSDATLTTTYSEVTEKPPSPAAPSWYFSTYQNDYALQKKEKLVLIESGKAAPGFSLDGFASTTKTSLDQYKGKLVLLEFWITHCGFCIAAVPKLNSIHQNYRDKGVEVISINMYDPAATIESFNKKHKAEYMILTGGESIAGSYGVESYPAIVLIDRSGKVVYSTSGLFEKELEAAIVANLKQ